jgi:glycerol uptake facilitator-like aquaporin
MDAVTDARPAHPLDVGLEPPREPFGPARRLAAEALGTALLLAVVVGSGIMGERLAAGNAAIALLGNTLATGAALVVLITVFGPISGAHFNPVVTAMFAVRRELSWRLALGYVCVQFIAAVLGVWAAHLMFAEPMLQVSTKARDGLPQGFAEAVATFGLIGTILGSLRFRPDATPVLVGLYITAAYWFTASTSFANPAVTFARSLTDTFAGIAPNSAPLFIVGQLVGAAAAVAVFGWLLGIPQTPSSPAGAPGPDPGAPAGDP